MSDNEPVEICPNCGNKTYAEWVDIGFGPYSQQAGPFNCYFCHWVESGCPQEVCSKEKCTSYEYCQGRSNTERLHSLVYSLLTALNITEESDNGRVFKPNCIHSSRVMHINKLNTILTNLEKEVGFKKQS